MLRDFFKLNAPFETYADAERLRDHFKTADNLINVLYKPDIWPADLPKMRSITFRNVSFAKTCIANATFTDCFFEDCLFIGATLEHLQFHRCHFKNCNFYKARITDCYLNPLNIELDRRYKKNASNIGTSLFHELMKNAQDLNQTNFHMHADILFRRWKRAQFQYDFKLGQFNRFQFASVYFKNLLYDILCGFGYRPLNFMAATLIVFIAISVLNRSCVGWFVNLQWSCAMSPNGTITTDFTLVQSLFYTFSVLTSLGFSDILPVSPLAKFLAMLESLAGIGWLGLFTAILVKRVLK